MVTDSPRYLSEEVLLSPGIEVNSFEELYMQKIAQETIYENHRASFFHIFWYKGEKNTHYIKNKKINVPCNSLLIVNHDILQRYSRHKCKGDMVLFNTIFFAKTQEKTNYLNQCALFKRDYIIIPSVSEDLISSVDLYISLMRKQTGKEIRETEIILLRNWLHNLLIIIERNINHRNGFNPVINSQNYLPQFKDLLDIHYQTEKQVSFYAKELNISERKLSQIVYTVHGISAKEYINEKISIEAIRLIENTTLNQGEIAAKLGFDFTYFVKFFRKHFGITPSKYRQGKKNVVI
ncbi:helix-turn-helix domain-containing protein [Dysgonomonas reticulitermitis]